MDIRPVLFKFGAALAFSIGGILFTILRTKKFKPSRSLPSQPPSGLAPFTDMFFDF